LDFEEGPPTIKKPSFEREIVVRQSPATETPQPFWSYESWDELRRNGFDETGNLAGARVTYWYARLVRC